MNNKEQPPPPLSPLDQEKIHISGRDYTLKEADALAIAEHNRCNNTAAVEIYDQILTTFPFYAGGWNNRAVMLNLLHRSEEALISVDRAISFKPEKAGFHSNRGDALQELGRYEDALASYDTALAIQPNIFEAHNGRAVVLQASGRYTEALVSIDKAIALRDNASEAHLTRGVILTQMGRYAEALTSLRWAISLTPNHAGAHNKRGDIFVKLQRYEEALASCDKAIALHPNHADAYNNRGNALRGLKQYDSALESFDKAISIDPDYADVYANMGNILVIKGDMQKAETMFLKALTLKKNFPVALFALARIRKYHDAENTDIKNIRALLDKPHISPQVREGCYFSLGKMYDDCGLYDEAFAYYQRANEICKTKVSYDPEATTRMTNSIMEVFTKEFLAQPFAFASDSYMPIFIVGMLRSGTTLMASILSNHPSVASAGEPPTIIKLTSCLSEWGKNGTSYPQAAKHITSAIASRLITDYEQTLKQLTGSDGPHIIDKTPTNFWHLGFISMLFPKARIIHCTRHPLDIALSNYFQWFLPDCDYAFDLKNIGHFYGEYIKIMEHWRKVLPTRMLEIRYEDVVMNTEPMVRQALDFLGLEWDEHCLSPHTNPYPVESTSSWQVRRPIYQESLDRWRHYEKHLESLKAMLPS